MDLNASTLGRLHKFLNTDPEMDLTPVLEQALRRYTRLRKRYADPREYEAKTGKLFTIDCFHVVLLTMLVPCSTYIPDDDP